MRPAISDYKSAGVDLGLGNTASQILYNAARLTWQNRQGKLGEIISPYDDFSGIRGIDVSGLPRGTILGLGFDGIGTKIELAERLDCHRTLAHDLLAMVCDDALVRGAEPVLVGSILDVNSLQGNVERIRQIAEGYVLAAAEANVAVINGELAELGNRVSGYGTLNYNWGAAVVWFARKDRMLTGAEIREGDSLVGLKEEGFRSNGISLARRVFSDAYGEQWHSAEFNAQSVGMLLLQPSRIYAGTVTEMFGGFDRPLTLEIHGIAHITGGGIPEKLGRVLRPSGLGAVIDAPFEPPAIMLHCQELGGVSDDAAYRAWNMGQGMVIITPEPQAAIKVADSHCIEAKIIGRIKAGPSIIIDSRGKSLQYG